MKLSKIVFPVSDDARELIMEVVNYLLDRSAESFPHDAHLKNSIDELLNYLPEVQFHGRTLQEVSIDGHHYQFMRKQPHRPLMDAIAAAEQFDTHQCEVMLMRYRYQNLEVAS